MVPGAVGIDGIAGPSEVMVVADGTADPEWIALESAPRPSTATTAPWSSPPPTWRCSSGSASWSTSW